MFVENTRGFLILLESRGADEILYLTFSNVKEGKIFFLLLSSSSLRSHFLLREIN